MAVTKSKQFKFVKFPISVVNEALIASRKFLGETTQFEPRHLSVTEEEIRWDFDKLEEFHLLYESPKVTQGSVSFLNHSVDFNLGVSFYGTFSDVSVKMPSRIGAETIFKIFEENAVKFTIERTEREESLKKNLRIFIGHGRNSAWRDLKDHLQDKHHYKVEAYETGARAGQTITDVLSEMATKSSFAILVMTAEDLDKEGNLHARENVIHEAGLFQGKLGNKRAIVLLEDTCSSFSNLAGVQYIPFSRNNIKETFGDVLATLYREFGVI